MMDFLVASVFQCVVCSYGCRSRSRERWGFIAGLGIDDTLIGKMLQLIPSHEKYAVTTGYHVGRSGWQRQKAGNFRGPDPAIKGKEDRTAWGLDMLDGLFKINEQGFGSSQIIEGFRSAVKVWGLASHEKGFGKMDGLAAG